MVTEEQPDGMTVRRENRALRAKYQLTGLVYDILDYYWERQYRRWRPGLLEDVRGSVVEAGVGTGRNLEHYHEDVELLGIDLSARMLSRARRRGDRAACSVCLREDDATVMSSVPSGHFDWLVSTFLCCVMPDELQPLAIEQFARVLKPGGRFRVLEMLYSKDPKVRKRQERFAPFVEKVYGARFDRNTLAWFGASSELEVTGTRYLKGDVYLVIEGVRL